MAEEIEQTGGVSDAIDPLSYIGRDLRSLPDEEITRILGQYGELRETADGYCLGQKVMALQAVRGGSDHNQGLAGMLNDDQRWIFDGSEETKKKNR